MLRRSLISSIKSPSVVDDSDSRKVISALLVGSAINLSTSIVVAGTGFSSSLGGRGCSGPIWERISCSSEATMASTLNRGFDSAIGRFSTGLTRFKTLAARLLIESKVLLTGGAAFGWILPVVFLTGAEGIRAEAGRLTEGCGLLLFILFLSDSTAPNGFLVIP